jgi:tyrosyl-tRNA synthetase
MKKNTYIKNLEWRGMIHNYVPGLAEQLNKEITSGYIGFDMTAPSLHIGNLATIMLAKHLQMCGHKPIIVLGGATSMAGDPSFKATERKLLSREQIEENQKKIQYQFDNFLDFSKTSVTGAELVNNYDWFADYSFLKFIRDIGKYITINYMMAKDSVKNRLEQGLSFTEFSYQLMQAYDFYYLYKNKQVKLQLGGADQWGNLTTGVELIRKKLGKEAFALTTPLITKKDGTKFGKSEGGENIWLDQNMTSPYKFYQFWLNVSDEDAKQLIKIFTLLAPEQIEQLNEEHNKMPNKHILQNALAKEITTMVHSIESYQKAHKTASIVFGKDIEQFNLLTEKELIEALDGLLHIDVNKEIVKNSMVDPILLLSEYTKNLICQSKSEAKRLIQERGVSINRNKIINCEPLQINTIKEKFIIVQKGKKKHYLLKLV